jgi:signal peptidase I
VLEPSPQILWMSSTSTSPTETVPGQPRNTVPSLLNDRFEVLLWLGETSKTSDFVGYDRLSHLSVVIRIFSGEIVNDRIVRRCLGKVFSKIHSLDLGEVVPIVEWGCDRSTVDGAPVHFLVTRPPDGPTLGTLIAQRGAMPAVQETAVTAAIGDLLNKLAWEGLAPSHIDKDNIWILPHGRILVDPIELALDIAHQDQTPPSTQGALWQGALWQGALWQGALEQDDLWHGDLRQGALRQSSHENEQFEHIPVALSHLEDRRLENPFENPVDLLNLSQPQQPPTESSRIPEALPGTKPNPIPQPTTTQSTSRPKASVRVRSFAVPVVSALLLALSWLSMAPPKWGGQLTFTVVSGKSMEPGFHTGDLVVLRRSRDYRKGDVVTYSVPEEPYRSYNIVHRIVDELADGRFMIRGDNRDENDPWLVSNSDIHGKQILLVAKGGFVLVFLSSPMGFALVFGVLVTAWLWGSPMLKGED